MNLQVILAGVLIAVSCEAFDVGPPNPRFASGSSGSDKILPPKLVFDDSGKIQKDAKQSMQQIFEKFDHRMEEEKEEQKFLTGHEPETDQIHGSYNWIQNPEVDKIPTSVWKAPVESGLELKPIVAEKPWNYGHGRRAIEARRFTRMY